MSIPAGEFAAETNTTGRSDVREFTVGSHVDAGELTGFVFLRDSPLGNSLDTSVVVKHFRDPTAVVNKPVEYEELYLG